MKDKIEILKNNISIEELASRLDLMQKEKNEGRGVNVVRSIIDCLRRGDVIEAKSIASWDHDKIRNYPDIEKLLIEQLFNGIELWRWTPEMDNK